MNGRRVYGVEPYRFSPGDYGKWLEDDDNWYAKTPNGHMANLSGHIVIEHADGTISVSPSIKVSTTMPRGKINVPVELWHGFLENGAWRTA